MLRDDIMFHNVAELEPAPGGSGWTLQRFPREVREALGKGIHQRGRFMAQASTGCELRFVTGAEHIRITLSATVEAGDILIYNGDYFHSVHRLQAGLLHTLQLDKPGRLSAVGRETAPAGRFSPDVWRVVISRNYTAGLGFQVVFHHLDTLGHPVRPPSSVELPGRVWLAYGSSITHGSGAVLHHSSYVQQTARRLGVDVWNKGIGGACFCEPEMADYLMSCGDWDAATLELGVNMRGLFTPDEFEARATSLIEGMLRQHPGKPVVLISMFPNLDDLEQTAGSEMSTANRQLTERLRQIYLRLDHPCLHLLDGHQLLPDVSGLTTDLIHPSDYGHTLIAEHLSQAMDVILQGGG
ncbi:SGNH/GDSL hydrolase family protein [Paenibacillus sp. 1P07SE]|uniref:SGNH/GDSL hydrolase family protein n=1 Tax=Paenibacillus sp. 1P07SE TaxID=3132209 RepID=UPI0039A46AF7